MVSTRRSRWRKGARAPKKQPVQNKQPQPPLPEQGKPTVRPTRYRSWEGHVPHFDFSTIDYAPVKDGDYWALTAGRAMITEISKVPAGDLKNLFAIQKAPSGDFWVTDGKAMFLVGLKALEKLRRINKTTSTILHSLPDDGEALQYWKGGVVEECHRQFSRVYDDLRMNKACRLYQVPCALPASDSAGVARGLSYFPMVDHMINMSNVIYGQELYLKGAVKDYFDGYYYAPPLHPEDNVNIKDVDHNFLMCPNIFASSYPEGPFCAIIAPMTRATFRQLWGEYTKSYSDIAGGE